MYPNLYYFFYDTFGVELNFLRAVNSFGLFVALAFVVAAFFFGRELRRKEQQGHLPVQKVKRVVGKPVSPQELIINALIGFLFGFKLVYAALHSEVFGDFPHFLFSKTGSWLGGIAGALLLAYWKYREVRKQQLEKPKEVEINFHAHEHVGPILILAVIWGFIGAKLFAWFEDPVDFKTFIADPFRGLTMYGGLICAAIAVSVYLRRKKLPLLQVYDASAPALILAYGIGRLGCQISGDGDWGIVNTAPKPGWMSFLPDWMWAYRYPNNVNGEGVPIPGCTYEPQYCAILEQPVFPTPLYETLMCLLIFGVLWILRKRINLPGILFMLYLIFNGIERFLIEQIRVNVKSDFLGIPTTQAELIALAFILLGIAGMVWLNLRSRRKSLG